MVKEFISQLPPDKLSPFEKHPYQVREDAAMDELVESIRVHGVLSPLLARPKGECYELVSGHRRRLAAQKLGLPTVPVLVREMSDDEAVILMVDSNLQRENLLPSEKAFAYKMKLEAMKHQGKSTSVQLAPKLTTEQIGYESGISKDVVKRYIRLTNLVPPLLQMVDDGRIAFSPAVELSYLTRDEQAELWDLIGREDATPSLSQALRMKQLSREAKLTPEVLYAILTEESPIRKSKSASKPSRCGSISRAITLRSRWSGRSSSCWRPVTAQRTGESDDFRILALYKFLPYNSGRKERGLWSRIYRHCRRSFLRTVFTTSCGASSIIPAFCRRSRTPQRTSCWRPSYARWRKHRASTRT